MSILTAIKEAINKFGQWIKSVFDHSEQIYEQLSADEQKAAQWGYGVIALVNKYGDAALPYIQLAYPDLSTDQLHGFLEVLLNKIKAVDAAVPLTLEDALKALSSYLNQFEGSTWEQISQAVGNLLAVMFSPVTPIQKFISIAEYVYQLFVKPKIAEVHTDGDPPHTCSPGYYWDETTKKCILNVG